MKNEPDRLDLQVQIVDDDESNASKRNLAKWIFPLHKLMKNKDWVAERQWVEGLGSIELVTMERKTRRLASLAYLVISFLDASSHLYKPLCLSVRPSVGRSVGRQRLAHSSTFWSKYDLQSFTLAHDRISIVVIAISSSSSPSSSSPSSSHVSSP